jgi:2-polyprenyl-6-methoxyphenol hydroxylase-like FAD-dependent oxidoreductase
VFYLASRPLLEFHVRRRVKERRNVVFVGGHAKPLGAPATFRNTAGVRRRYDTMPRFPGGLLVIGDALCSPNPIYGQGMTFAALEAVALRDCLKAGDGDLAAPFFLAASRHIGATWAMNQASDRDPTLEVKHPTLGGRAKSLVTRSLFRAAERDIVLTERFLRVRNLIDQPTRLRDPALMARVLAVNLRHRQIPQNRSKS